MNDPQGPFTVLKTSSVVWSLNSVSILSPTSPGLSSTGGILYGFPSGFTAAVADP